MTLLKRIRRWNAIRKTYEELAQLDERML